MGRWLLAGSLTVVLAACVDPLTTHPVSRPEFEVKNVTGYAETAAGAQPDTTFAWDLRVVGDVARWRECVTVDDCRDTQRERATKEVLAVERVGVTIQSGREADVVKLSLAASPKYVVPAWKAGVR